MVVELAAHWDNRRVGQMVVHLVTLVWMLVVERVALMVDSSAASMGNPLVVLMVVKWAGDLVAQSVCQMVEWMVCCSAACSVGSLAAWLAG